MRALSLVGGFLAAGSLLAVLTAVPALSAPADTPQPEAESSEAAAPGCDPAESPTAQLMCRDAKLAAAGAAMDAALAALGATTDDSGRAAIEDSQTVWRARRDESCPVTAADLADAKSAKARADCLLRVVRKRTAALEAERQARSRPVGDLPLSVTGAAARRFAAPQTPVPPISRKVSLSTLAGRWAKADPGDRTAIDDCRSSYLDIGTDRSLHAVEPRLQLFPLDGTLAADGDPVQGVALLPTAPTEGAQAGGTAPLATLRLLPADSPRFDRLILRMEPPASFAAEFVRCR
ncbi:lysozyme inhibitor LprI family protein [Azospirillum sp. B2RO_4]|uniref:lysozyme inhibitor LprI family protein n=1 Tax=Azospirillum sp. B2RO_4 TaxID=3027796 RepID=UPI003DA9CA38